MIEIEPDKKGPKGSWLLMVIIALIILVVLLTAIIFFKEKNSQPAPVPADIARNTGTIAVNGLIPQNSKDSDDFLAKVTEKSDEIKKNYNSNLVEFAGKRWKKFFLEQNSPSGEQNKGNLKIENQEISTEDNGSTIYRISYIYDGNRYSDFFYLLLSDTKVKELGFADLDANRFLSEPEIKKYINQPDFAKISKINK